MATKGTLETTVCFSVGRSEQHEVEAVISYEYVAPTRDFWSKSLGGWLPGDPAELEITSITTQAGDPLPAWMTKLLDADDELRGWVAEEADEAERARQAEAMEARAERKYDR